MGSPDTLTLRVNRPELTRLGWALVASLVLHLFCWGTYSVGKKLHWWEKLRLPAWVQKLAPPPLQSKAKQPPVNRQPPLMFVEVVQPSSEPPKDTKFYSDRNSVASNPDLDQASNVPKIDGTQEQVVKTEDAQRNKFPLMPDPPPPPPKEQAPEDGAPKPKLSPGTMTVAKADLKPQPERTRPRTIKEAMLRNQLPGQKMKQSGGAQQRPNTGLDVKATGFGAYDRAFIDAVSSRWYDLLDNMSYEAYQPGRVKLEFNLNYDGRITEIRVLETTVTETLTLLCQKAVLDPAPFEKWNREMRLMIGEDSRRITFTFFYN